MHYIYIHENTMRKSYNFCFLISIVKYILKTQEKNCVLYLTRYVPFLFFFIPNIPHFLLIMFYSELKNIFCNSLREVLLLSPSENVFILPSIQKVIFTEYRILTWFSFFKTRKICPFLLSFMVSGMKFSFLNYCSCIRNVSSFSGFFHIFSLSLVSSLIIWYLSIEFFQFIMFRVWQFS